MKTKKIYELMGLSVMMSLSVLLTGCGTNKIVSQTPTTTPVTVINNETQIPVEKQPDVTITSNPTLGEIFTDGNGMTLYVYTKDTKNLSACYDTCAINWPPLLVTDSPTIATNLVSSNFGFITRANGDKQVTYKGMPLYRWIKDVKSGDATGEGVGGIWFVHKTTSDDLAQLK